MSDQKDAVGIGVNLSSQIITACLTMIALVGAFVTFALDKRNLTIPYYLLTAASFMSFVASIYYGGKGINLARINGNTGNWDILLTKKIFNNQAGLAFLGIIFFCISIFLGNDKISDQQSLIEKLSQKIHQMQIANDRLKIQIELTNKNYYSLRKTVDSLSNAKPKVSNVSNLKN